MIFEVGGATRCRYRRYILGGAEQNRIDYEGGRRGGGRLEGRGTPHPLSNPGDPLLRQEHFREPARTVVSDFVRFAQICSDGRGLEYWNHGTVE